MIIPLKISLQKSYGTLGFQRTKVTPLRDTAKFQKNTGGHADHNFMFLRKYHTFPMDILDFQEIKQKPKQISFKKRD